MDPDQFSAFITSERNDRAAAREAGHQQHQQRQVTAVETACRHKAEAQAKRVPSCDGANTKSVREWLREIGFTIPYSDLTVYIAARTAEGTLRREVERYLADQPNRDAVTWDQLKLHIQHAFLSPHEADKLRDEVQAIKENAYEGTAAYSRRFRDTADLGYPPAHRNDDQHRIMKDAYLRGLQDHKLVERLVKEGRPANFMAAITLVEQYSSDDYALQRAMDGVGATHPGARREEPMEIGVTTATTGTGETETLRRDVVQIQKQVTGMTKQITRLSAAVGVSGSANTKRVSNFKPKGKYQFTPEGVPICVRCERPGHVIRECTANKDHQKRAPTGHQMATATHAGGQ